MCDGIVIIAGTGSIAYGACEGRSMRCGGWDYELGDEGSGGWLGKELLRVRRELDITDDFEVIEFAQKNMASRSRISQLAPLVAEAARAGDASARAILEHAAQEEAEMVAAIVRGIFDGCERIPVTYIGGTFKAGDLVLEPLAAALPRRCELVPPQFEPDRGAVLILQKRLGMRSISSL